MNSGDGNLSAGGILGARSNTDVYQGILVMLKSVSSQLNSMATPPRFISPKKTLQNVHDTVTEFICGLEQAAMGSFGNHSWPTVEPSLVSAVNSVRHIHHPPIGGFPVSSNIDPSDLTQMVFIANRLSHSPKDYNNSPDLLLYDLDTFSQIYEQYMTVRAQHLSPEIMRIFLPSYEDIVAADKYMVSVANLLLRSYTIADNWKQTIPEDRCASEPPGKDCCSAHSFEHILRSCLGELFDLFKSGSPLCDDGSLQTRSRSLPHYMTGLDYDIAVVELKTHSGAQCVIPETFKNIAGYYHKHIYDPDSKHRTTDYWADRLTVSSTPNLNFSDPMAPAQAGWIHRGLRDWEVIKELNYTEA